MSDVSTGRRPVSPDLQGDDKLREGCVICPPVLSLIAMIPSDTERRLRRKVGGYFPWDSLFSNAHSQGAREHHTASIVAGSGFGTSTSPMYPVLASQGLCFSIGFQPRLATLLHPPSMNTSAIAAMTCYFWRPFRRSCHYPSQKSLRHYKEPDTNPHSALGHIGNKGELHGYIFTPKYTIQSIRTTFGGQVKYNHMGYLRRTQNSTISMHPYRQ